VIGGSEFAALYDPVARAGKELMIERALDAGAPEVKTVELPAPADASVEPSRSLGTRTLD
jgi:hypothetical protein